MSRYDIAIIGMGCIFPGANSTKQYWENIKDGRTFFSKMPDRLWHADCFSSPDRSLTNKSYTDIGAFIEGFEFPFLKYRLPPNALKGVDPAQLVTLEAVSAALADAGLEPRSPALSEGVTIIGSSGVDAFAHSTSYLKRHDFMARLRPRLRASGVPDAMIDELMDQLGQGLQERGHVWNPSVASVGAIPSSVSNRVAQVFGVRGFNMTVDAACASSMAAIDVACQALMAGDARIAIAGGTDLGTNPAIYIGFSRVDGLSASGRTNPFDATADGLVIGEGGGVVVLKRLEDALADRDRIHAVIRGIGGSSDGAGQAIYAPSVRGRVEALEHGLAKAQIDRSDVQFLEAHATSTVVGDANEYDAIATVYGQGRATPLRLGSVKHQIGHLKAAAGVAGLIKTVLAMEHGIFPHLPRFTTLTPGAQLVTDALLIPNQLAPWEPNASGERVAAVTANGFGGVNYHTILTQAERYEGPPPRPAVPRAVAVVGMECRVAKADNIETFWKNTTEGVDCFTEVDPVALNWQHHIDTGPESERITTKVVSRLDDYAFNALRFKIFPNSLSQISPTQLLAVDLGDRLLTAAGFDMAEPKKIAVSLGSMHDDHFPTIWPPMIVDEYLDVIRKSEVYGRFDRAVLEDALALAAKAMIDDHPPSTEHTLPGWMTNVTAGRIANKLNLCGPNLTVDTACSSGIAALVPAVYQLMFGNVDLVISGGLNRQLSDTFTCGVCALGAVAERTPRPFDASGQGFLIGEGGVLYLLKRLADAERDGDTIYAIIDAVHGSSEADSKSMVAPSEEAMARSIRTTMSKARTRPEEIGVVDTHGSANPVSDIVESRAIAAELRRTDGAEPVQITAIKSHIGHLYGGSGAASMLSTIMALRTRTVPGIRNLNAIRPEVAELAGRVEPRKGTRPLAPSFTAGAVNSLGLGGANYFVVLRGAPTQRGSKVPSAPPPPSRQAKQQSVRRDDAATHDIFVCLAEREQDFETALSRAIGQSPIPEIITEGSRVGAKLAVTFEDQEGLRSKLDGVLRMLRSGASLGPLESRGVFVATAEPDAKRPDLAFCFPGQGVQYVGMGKPLYQNDPVFRGVIDQIQALAKQFFDFDLIAHIHGDPDDAEIQKRLGTLVGAQTSVFAIEVAMATMLRSLGVEPDVLIGQSFGEIAALTVAGVWDVETAYRVVKARIEAADKVNRAGGPPLGMMSLVCSEEQRDAILGLVGEKVVLTNINAPNRFILSGEIEAIKKTVAVASSFGAEARHLAIGGAFHSHYMEPVREGYRQVLAELPCSTPTLPILSTITGDYLRPPRWTSDYVAELLSNQLVTKVDLVKAFRKLHHDGTQHFLEAGPGWSLTKMITSILEGMPHRAAPTLHPKVGDAETFRRARAFLMTLGHLESAAERENLPGVFSPDFLEYMETQEPAVLALINEVHRRFLARLRDAEGPREVAPLPAPAPAPARVQAPAAAPVEAPRPAAPPPAPAPEAPKPIDPKVWIERVRSRLVDVTGYPAEMLEDHLDLEADLGVDSVQRAEIWVSLTAAFGLDAEQRPTGVRTIAHLAEAFAKLEAAAAPPPPPPGPPPFKPAHPAPEAPKPIDPKVWIERVRSRLVDVTGYPAEMLEDHLDLEADLGVDSVQRAEIWVSLTAAFGLDAEQRPTGVRTIAHLAEAFARLEAAKEPPPEPSGPSSPTPASPAPSSAPASSAPSSPAPAGPAASAGPAPADQCQLFLASTRPVSNECVQSFACKKALVIARPDGTVRDALATLLSRRGVKMTAVSPEEVAAAGPEQIGEMLRGRDTLLYLAHDGLGDLLPDGAVLRAALDGAWRQLFKAFQALAPALEKHPMRVIVPVSQDGGFGIAPAGRRRLLGAFPGGFVRSLARELPRCTFQLIDADREPWAEAIERYLTRVCTHLEVGVRGGSRVRPTFAPLAQPTEQRSPLERGDLVLVTGGARGIVFECVAALAQRTGCRLLLTGRTPPPAAGRDRPAWMDASPQEIDREVRDLEIRLVKNEGLGLREAKQRGVEARATWEVDRNLKRLREAGVEARYEVCDVTDPRAFRALVESVVRAGDVVRGVVHGAGVQRAKLIGQLEEAAIERTINTKLGPLFTLLDVLDWTQVRLLAAFGSVTGVFGNAGQTDYGLANDLLAGMVTELGAMQPHLQAQTIEWTAWAGAGMVSDEEIKRFEQAGLKPLDLRRGVELFLEGLLGSTHRRLVAFNPGAAFAAARPLEEHHAAARPRSRLVETVGQNGTSSTVKLSLTRDPYLMQHLVNEEPVVPGTFITEMFAEIARESGVAVADVQFRRPLQLRGRDLDVEVMRSDSTLIALPASRPALDGKALVNLSYSSCRLDEPGPSAGAALEFTDEHLRALEAGTALSGDSFYALLDQNFAHVLRTGPVFRGIRATVELDGLFLGAVTITDDANALLETPGQFVFNPVLADMAVQVVAVYAMQKHRVLAIPYELGRLHVGGPTRGRRAVVVCRPHECTREATTVDLAVREPEGRLIFAFDRLVLRTIDRSQM